MRALRPHCFGIGLLVSGLLLCAASSATASITVGQVAAVPFGNCASDADRMTTKVSAGTAYVMPSPGTLTSWSTNAGSSPGQQWTMKVFRPVGSQFIVVAHDGPRVLTTGHALSTFPVNIPVQTGDLLGAHPITSGTDCIQAAAAGDLSLYRLLSDMPDNGPPETFSTVTNSRTNISAELSPVNTFTVGKAKLNKKKGTAAIPVTLPGPGEVSLSGKGIKTATATATAASTVTVTVKTSGKTKKTLGRNGKAKLKPTVTFTPTGGTANPLSLKLKLKKK